MNNGMNGRWDRIERYVEKNERRWAALTEFLKDQSRRSVQFEQRIETLYSELVHLRSEFRRHLHEH